MRIKTKLLIGFGLLFLVVVFFGIVAVYYIDDISEYSKVTLKNNYNTLTFTRAMREALDENYLPLPAKAVAAFDNALKKQENNITEPGEKEATANLRSAFARLTDPSQSLDQKSQIERNIRLQLKTIDGLNMNAIVQKNNQMHATVSNATLYLGGIVFVTFLILFVFIINFPNFILNPLNQFIEGVHQVNQNNYDVKMQLTHNDEFALLAGEFNTMVNKLSESENESLTKVFAADNRIKAIIEEIPYLIIGVNEKQELLFVNSAARGVFNLGDRPLTGQSAKDLARSNHLLKSVLDHKGEDGKMNISVKGQMSDFQIRKIETVVPNLRPGLQYTMQFASFPAGMVYILKPAGDLKEHDEVKNV
jgi:nitrogen fixation/metabolism regulation signal transduction histidine kinase